MRIRRILPDEYDIFKQTRLTALKTDPQAFGSTFEHSLERTEESWIDQAESCVSGRERATFFAGEDDIVVGMASIYQTEPDSTSGELIQMWVSPQYRGKAVSSAIIQVLLDWAETEGYEQIIAEVRSSNKRALRFYEKMGFLINRREDESVFMYIILS